MYLGWSITHSYTFNPIAMKLWELVGKVFVIFVGRWPSCRVRFGVQSFPSGYLSTWNLLIGYPIQMIRGTTLFNGPSAQGVSASAPAVL